MKNTQSKPGLSRAIIAIFVVAILATSCANSELGIFQSIELEREIIDDRELSNELTIGSITRSGTRYFIAAGSLWHREVVDPDYQAGEVAQWQRVGGPDLTNATTTSLVKSDVSGTELIYAVYTSQDGLQGGVYTVDPADPPAEITYDPVFAFDTDSSSPEYTADREGLGSLFLADDGLADYLMVVVQLPGVSQYAVYGSTDGSAFSEITGLQTNLPVIDVSSDGTNVAFLTGKTLVLDTDGLGAGAAPANVTSDISLGTRSPIFGGLYYQQSAGILWLSDNEGFLHRSTDFGATAGNWSVNATAFLVREDGPALQFTEMISLDSEGSELLIAGTNGDGYREVVETEPGVYTSRLPDAAGSNYQASDLAQASILDFFVNPGVTVHTPTQDGTATELKTGDLLFAATSDLGLWKGLFTDTPVQWVQE